MSAVPRRLAAALTGLLPVALVAGLLLASPSSPAYADGGVPVTPGTGTPGTAPAAWTPQVLDGAVLSVVQVGNVVVLGGSFTKVATPNGVTVYDRSGIVAINATTGSIKTGFAPTLNGEVHTLVAGPTPGTVLVGGTFNTVDGQTRRNLVSLVLADGSIDPAFTPPAIDASVDTAVRVGERYLIGGIFTKVGGQDRGGLASISATTGALDGYLTVSLAQNHNWTSACSVATPACAWSPIGATQLAVAPDGSQLAVIGNFRTADGLARDQVALISLGTAAAQVRTDWATSAFEEACNPRSIDSYVRGVAFGPDGSYIAIAATGGTITGTCDAVTRLEADVTGTDVQPTWMAASGRDTFLSVATTGAAIYVGGHFRWLNNDYGSDNKAQGAVPRPSVAALDPVSGRPLSWNPGRIPRGYGVTSLLVTDAGLWMGSDTDYVGNHKYFRPKIAFFPFSAGAPVASEATPTLPSGVALGGPLSGGDGLAFRLFDGSTVGESQQATSTVTWSKVDGAVRVGDWLYLTKNDAFYRAAFDGTRLGSLKKVDPYNDPAWCGVLNDGKDLCGVVPSFYSELGDVTALTYTDGRLYYAKAGSTTLQYRFFSPDTGIVGPTSYVVAGSIPAGAAALLLDGTDLYAADRSGTLYKSTLTDEGVGADPVAVSGPGVDGISWAAHAVFLTGSDTVLTTTPTPDPTPTPTPTPPVAKPVIVTKASIDSTKLKKNGRLVVKWKRAEVRDGSVIRYRLDSAKKRAHGWASWTRVAEVPGTAHKAVWNAPAAGKTYRLRLTTVVDGATATSKIKLRIPAA